VATTRESRYGSRGARLRAVGLSTLGEASRGVLDRLAHPGTLHSLPALTPPGTPSHGTLALAVIPTAASPRNSSAPSHRAQALCAFPQSSRLPGICGPGEFRGRRSIPRHGYSSGNCSFRRTERQRYFGPSLVPREAETVTADGCAITRNDKRRPSARCAATRTWRRRRYGACSGIRCRDTRLSSHSKVGCTMRAGPN
jgi:hypothetical protein